MSICVALIQFDAVPERVDRNLARMRDLVAQSASAGARWVMFHEGTVADYTPRLAKLAERVPQGKSTRAMIAAARRWNCFVSFGLSEKDRGRTSITQVFVGPKGFVHRYRKTWLWRDAGDRGYRNEWNRYDPGTGPELFVLDGVKATCFICADGEAPRCIERARELAPDVVFYPNNRANLPTFEEDRFARRARRIGAPMLVTNRVGKSWVHDCQGGCVVYSARGRILARANREGREEILLHDLKL